MDPSFPGLNPALHLSHHVVDMGVISLQHLLVVEGRGRMSSPRRVSSRGGAKFPSLTLVREQQLILHLLAIEKEKLWPVSVAHLVNHRWIVHISSLVS